MILIALGSNLGDRTHMLRAARQALETSGVYTMLQSRLVETPALLPKDAPAAWNQAFLNQVMAVRTAHTPLALLAVMQTIERQLGRTPRGHWAPREIDLDLLAYDQHCSDDAPLILPHPQMQHRRFVLAPLVEIAPDWIHPRLQRTARQLLAELPA